LTLHKTQKQIETDQAVKKNQDVGCPALINSSEKGNRLAVAGYGEKKKEQIEAPEQCHPERSPKFMIVINVALFHAVPVSEIYCFLWGFLMSLMATQVKITTRMNPQKSQSAVVNPNIVNSS
jgi:hypothetical protein